MAREENQLHWFNEISPNARYSLDRGETFAENTPSALAQIVGKRLRAIYPLADSDEPAALRNLIDELAAKGL